MGSDGVAGGVRLWARAEVRRRWPSLVLLGVLAGLAAGLAMAAVDGAGRAATAYDRMRSQRLAADAVFFPSQVGFSDADVTRLSEIPEVEAWGGFTSTVSQFDEFPGDSPLVMVGSDWFSTIERADVVEGRLPDPAHDDEAVVNVPALADGGSVGMTVTWRNLSPADIEALHGYPPPDWDWSQATGPVTRLRIVGVVRQPMESVTSFASSAVMWVSPAWAEAHLNSTAIGFNNAFVRLRHGAADLPAFEAGVARVYGRDDIPVKDLSDDIKRVQRSLDLERTALLLFAAAVIVAALVLIGQAFVRSVRAGAEAAPAMRALGLDRRSLVAGLMAPHIVTTVAAALTAGFTAVALSSQFPIGLGRRLDPDLGFHIDWLALVLGVVVTAVATAAVCGLAAWRAVRRLTPRRRMLRTQLVGAATRAGASVPVAVGTSMALEPAPSRVGATARPALVAAVVGVLGVVGAVTLVGGIDDVLNRPERVGQTWDLQASTSGDPAMVKAMVDSATTSLAGDPDVDAFALMCRAARVVDGKGDVPLYSLRSLGGSMHFTVLSGRAPDGDDEVALGPRTAAAIGAHIGDTVTVGSSARPSKVVGITLLAQTPHTSFDEGVLASPLVLDAEVGTDPDATDTSLLVRLRPGASIQSTQEALNAMGFYVELPTEPPDVANLANVRNLPLYLAAFLLLLAIGAIAHALLTGARSRSHDLAVLRALGLTPRQAAACVIWQATIIGVVALVIGIPLGVVVGREVWRVLADSLSFVYVGPLVGVALVVIVPVALVVVAVMALGPARGASRLHTAETLRTE